MNKREIKFRGIRFWIYHLIHWRKLRRISWNQSLRPRDAERVRKIIKENYGKYGIGNGISFNCLSEKCGECPGYFDYHNGNEKCDCECHRKNQSSIQ